ncbi:MAG: DNA repair protein RecN [Firmicutes bacterium]|nr:DNA repair protein RecN [Bacillota bacterium]
MLRQLQIQNYALIESLDLDFEGGLTVLTGETGAGKSIILDAIAMLTGSRAYTEAIRTGAETSWLAATFDATGIDGLKEMLVRMGFAGEGRELVVAREIHRSGRNKCWVNGRLATVAALREIGSFLVEIHGQEEHQAVLDSHQHLDMLDAMGGSPLMMLRQQVEKVYTRSRALAQERQRLVLSEQDRLRQIDLLQFQRDEINEANLIAGEEVELKKERELLRHGEKLREAVVSGYHILHGQAMEASGVLSGLGEVVNLVEQVQEYDERLTSILELLEAASANAEEAAWELRGYAEGLEADPQRLSRIEERLALIHRLERKYGQGTESIIAYGEEVEAELEILRGSELRVTELEAELEKAVAEFSDLAGQLSAKRQATAKELEQKVLKELPDLNLANARFEVQLSQLASEAGVPYPSWGSKTTVQAGPRGVDHAEFMFSANPGEDLKPLAKVASGGEASRLMLALKSVIAAVDGVPTLIFDEVDTGIGGRTARAVGDKLAALAGQRQVLCVTHLAQVAGMADHHLAISKEVEAGSTRVVVRSLEKEGRIEEVARMLAGDGASAVSRQHARQLLAQRASS